MSEAQDASSYVYQGLWTNWSKGKVYGATLTLSPNNSVIVISVIAIFIQLVGSQIWKLSQLALHQFRSSPGARDGLFHEQQVVLRNSATDLSTLWQLFRIAIAWRHQVEAKSFKRSLALIVWCLLHFACFIAAGVFASSVLESGDEVLSRSPYCGTINWTYYNSLTVPSSVGMPSDLVVEYNNNIQSRLQQSQQYVQFCTGPSAACNGLPKRVLAWNWTVEELCPFAAEVCSETNRKSIVLDTGLLSSHQDFGINAPTPDHVFYRKVTTCTTLNDAKYISGWKDIPATAESPAKQVVDAYYGPARFADRNATYSYSEWKQYYSFDQYSDTNPYSIDVQLGVAGDSTGDLSDFVPIPELARSDADIMMVFLSFSKVYGFPVSDPWFWAKKAEAYPTRAGGIFINGTIYTRQQPVTTLSCTEQHQICIQDKNSSSGNGKRCTPLTGYYMLSSNPVGALSLNLTARQSITYERIFQAAVDSIFYRVLHYLAQRDPPILARSLIQGFVGSRLPDDQWQREARYWHSIAMTNFQRRVIEYSTGQFVARTEYVNTTGSPEQTWLCQNQIIRGTSYRSFNFFSLMLVFALGLIIIITGLTMEDCLAMSRDKRSYRSDGNGMMRQEMWVKNEMLEMLRILFEREAGTIWSHSPNGIPISAPGQVMSIAQLGKSVADPQRGHNHCQHARSSGTTATSNLVTPESREDLARQVGMSEQLNSVAQQMPWDDLEMPRYGMNSRSGLQHRTSSSEEHDQGDARAYYQSNTWDNNPSTLPDLLPIGMYHAR